MRRQRLHLGAIAVLAVSVVGTARGADLGDPAAELQISKWVKGGPVELADGERKTVYVVEFWATWCPPCRASIPHLTRLQKRFKDKGVVFVGISTEDAAEVEPFVKKMGEEMDYVVAIDDEGATDVSYMGEYEIDGIPHAFIVDRDGRVAWHGHPMVGLDTALEAVLAGTYDLAGARKVQRAERLLPRYFALARQAPGAPQTAALGRGLYAYGKDSADFLNNFAWAILTDPALEQRDLKLAMKAAKRAYDLCSGKDANTVDTYARALFDTGQVAEAVKKQEQAVELCGDDDELREEFNGTLKRYKDAAEGG